MLPYQAGVLLDRADRCMLVVAFDFARPRSARNFELIILLSIGFLLFNVMRFFELLEIRLYFWVMDLVFTGIVAVSLALIGVADLARRHPHASPWQPNLPARPLMTLAILLLAMNVVTGAREPARRRGLLHEPWRAALA